jgi:hypothetical protein
VYQTVQSEKDEVIATLKKMVELLNRDGAATSHMWSIVSAMRGPDVRDTVSIKPLTTERVRAAIGLKDDHNSGGFLVNEEPLSPLQRADRNEFVPKNTVHGGQHFATHYNMAVDAIRELFDYDLETETPIARRPEDMTTKVAILDMGNKGLKG